MRARIFLAAFLTASLIRTTAAQTTVGSDGSYSVTLDLTSGSYRARVTAGHGFAIGISDTLVVQ